MECSIRDYNLTMGTYETYKYDVEFFSDIIDTTVTKDPTVANEWIAEVQSNFHSSPIVGLDVEWRPNLGRSGPLNPVATLQLCTGNRCLIYQLIHSSRIPYALRSFLSNPYITFVGVGIGADLQKLWNDYGIGGESSRRVELARLAADITGRPAWNQIGLKDLARHVLGKVVEKPERVTLSRWDQERLTAEQVQYACVDAFVSSEIGKALNASTYYY